MGIPTITTYKKYTFNGKTVHVVKSPYDNLKMTRIDEYLKNTGYIGINGTFFVTTEDDGILGIASNNGVPIGDCTNTVQCGIKNGSQTADRNRGTLYIQNDGTIGVQRAVYLSELPSHKMAVGGGSLALNDTDTTFNQIYDDEGWTINFSSPPDGTARSRSAIGYNGSDVYIIATDLLTISDLRNFCKNTLYLDDAIFLDGGKSTQFRTYDANLNEITYEDVNVVKVNNIVQIFEP